MTSSDETRSPSLCPSAQSEWKGSVLIGVVGGTADDPRVRFTPHATPPTPELLALAAPVHPTEVFRFAAPCLCKGCVHFQQDRCHLVERVVKLLPAVSQELPACSIRPHCRWWQQEGAAACMRCPQVVTENHNPSVEMIQAAQPAVAATSVGCPQEP